MVNSKFVVCCLVEEEKTERCTIFDKMTKIQNMSGDMFNPISYGLSDSVAPLGVGALGGPPTFF